MPDLWARWVNEAILARLREVANTNEDATDLIQAAYDRDLRLPKGTFAIHQPFAVRSVQPASFKILED